MINRELTDREKNNIYQAVRRMKQQGITASIRRKRQKDIFSKPKEAEEYESYRSVELNSSYPIRFPSKRR